MENCINVNLSDSKNHKIISHHPLLDTILNFWHKDLGDNYEPYKNHCLRVINYAFFQLKPNEEMKQKIIFTTAFHQLSLFINQKENINDYHKSSAHLFESFYDNFNYYHSDAVLNAILKHNTIQPKFYNDFCFEAVFWNCYFTDLSYGTFNSHIPKDFIKKVKECIPNKKYHNLILRKKIHSFF